MFLSSVPEMRRNSLILDSKQQNRRLILHNCEANVRCGNIRAGSFVKVIKAKLIEVLTK